MPYPWRLFLFPSFVWKKFQRLLLFNQFLFMASFWEFQEQPGSSKVSPRRYLRYIQLKELLWYCSFSVQGDSTSRRLLNSFCVLKHLLWAALLLCLFQSLEISTVGEVKVPATPRFLKPKWSMCQPTYSPEKKQTDLTRRFQQTALPSCSKIIWDVKPVLKQPHSEVNKEGRSIIEIASHLCHIQKHSVAGK